MHISFSKGIAASFGNGIPDEMSLIWKLRTEAFFFFFHLQIPILKGNTLLYLLVTFFVQDF